MSEIQFLIGRRPTRSYSSWGTRHRCPVSGSRRLCMYVPTGGGMSEGQGRPVDISSSSVGGVVMTESTDSGLESDKNVDNVEPTTENSGQRDGRRRPAENLLYHCQVRTGAACDPSPCQTSLRVRLHPVRGGLGSVVSSANEVCGTKPRPQTHFYAFRPRESHLVITFLVIFIPRFLVLADGEDSISPPSLRAFCLFLSHCYRQKQR